MKKLIKKFKEDLDEIAELSWREEKTVAYIKKELGGKINWSQKTAVIYELGSGTPVFFRAELDGLKTATGVKHICGHSAHLAALMACYLTLKKSPPKNHKIYFVFQPSEESWPSGASFISQNWNEINKCRLGFGFHVLPNKKLGDLFSPHFASADYFEILISGKSGHIKDKNRIKSTDPLITAANIIKKINSHKNEGWIINIGTINGGTSANKIAGAVLMSGDIRAINQKSRTAAESFLKTVIKTEKLTARHLSIALKHELGYPILKNSPKILNIARKILPIKSEIMEFGSEDFSLYPTEKLFLLIGTGEKHELHREDFSIKTDVAEKIYENWMRISENLHLFTKEK